MEAIVRQLNRQDRAEDEKHSASVTRARQGELCVRSYARVLTCEYGRGLQRGVS